MEKSIIRYQKQALGPNSVDSVGSEPGWLSEMLDRPQINANHWII